MLLRRALQRQGKRVERALQRSVVLPRGDEACTGDELRDVAFGRRDAGFLARAQLERPLRGAGKRRCRIVDERDSARAAVAKKTRRHDKIVASAGLRKSERDEPIAL